MTSFLRPHRGIVPRDDDPVVVVVVVVVDGIIVVTRIASRVLL